MGESHRKVLVIVPAYNETDSIKKVVEDIRGNMPFADILIINDGSSDDTEKKAREEIKKYDRYEGNCNSACI